MFSPRRFYYFYMRKNYSLKNPVIMKCGIIDHVHPNIYEFRLTSFKSTKLKKRPRRKLLDSITIDKEVVKIKRRTLRQAISEHRLSMFSVIKNGNMLFFLSSSIFFFLATSSLHSFNCSKKNSSK